jgi:phenylpropionate dioxygenase-like ring-hydroxylating dioxygenase large terminal subunit
MNDPVVENDWHPVAASGAVVDKPVRASLLGRAIVLWRSADGELHAWEDRCPHRGTRLSIGRVRDNTIECAYHGWRFGPDARCVLAASQPAEKPPDNAAVRSYRLEDRYGLAWVCLGEPALGVPPFPEAGEPELRKVICGPYEVACSGPRIVENFLDMAHFAFVHAGILGDPARTKVRDYRVAPWSDPDGSRGVISTQCFAWQPQTNSLSHGGSEVEYTYRVVRPLTAILTKVPETQHGFREAISIHVQPLEEEASRVWMILAMTNFQQAEEELRAFQDRIFQQDRPILEAQQPRRLPLARGAELPVRSDAMSLAYRRHLRELGLRYGVVA